MREWDNNNNNGDARTWRRSVGDGVGGRSLARVHVYDFLADFALDVATPVELALTSLGDLRLIRVIAAPTAHQLTALGTLGEPVTSATLSTRRSGLLVRQTIIWRLVDVDHVLL